MRVVVGLSPKSKTRTFVRRERLPVFDAAGAVERADVIFLALPDTKMPRVFSREIAPSLRSGQTLLFAHGFAVFYRTLVPPSDVDVVMVAPKGLGTMVRKEFVEGRGVPGLIAVHQDRNGKAKRTALAWAKAIGCTRAGVIETDFRAETESDIFGEQAVLCGGMTALICAGFDTLVRAGYPAELAYFECLHELKFIVDLMHERGIAGMTALISDTAQWGELTVGPKIIDQHVRANMQRALRQIRSGAFAREFIREMSSGQRRYRKLMRNLKAQPIEQTGKKLRGLTSWRRARK